MEAEAHRHLPSLDRISIVTALVLMTFAFTPFLGASTQSIKFALGGIQFDIPMNLTTLISVFAAVMAAAGTDWVLQGHPHIGRASRMAHWVLPGLTAWAIGVPLSRLKAGGGWWMVFGLGSVLLVLVILSEYITLDLEDTRYPPAALGLTVVAFAMFLIVVVAVRGSGSRLYLMLLFVLPVTFLVALKTLYMRLHARWAWVWSMVTALVAGQAAFGLYYTPLSPLKYGLLLTGLVYALISLAGGFEESHSWRRIWIEPLIVMLVFGLLALVIHA